MKLLKYMKRRSISWIIKENANSSHKRYSSCPTDQEKMRVYWQQGRRRLDEETLLGNDSPHPASLRPRGASLTHTHRCAHTNMCAAPLPLRERERKRGGRGYAAVQPWRNLYIKLGVSTRSTSHKAGKKWTDCNYSQTHNGKKTVSHRKRLLFL